MSEQDFNSLINNQHLPAAKHSAMGMHLFEEKTSQIDFGFLDYQLLSESSPSPKQNEELEKWIALQSQQDQSTAANEPAPEEVDPIQALVQQVMGKLDQNPRNKLGTERRSVAAATTGSVTPLFSQSANLIETRTLPHNPPVNTSSSTFNSGAAHRVLQGKVECLLPLLQSLIEELRQEFRQVLDLNPSRREHLLNYLNVLSGTQSLHHRYAENNEQIKQLLRDWFVNPQTASQESALRSYLEEVALVFLGQALLLKAWSDRGLRRWSSKDLGQLNWLLANTLKPYLPADGDRGWKITKPNLYTWYRPSERVLEKVFLTLDAWNLNDEGPQFIAGLLRICRRHVPNMPELCAYDERFYKILWEKMEIFGFTWEPILAHLGFPHRKRSAFSPTLRDGSLIRAMPAVHNSALEWIGLELNPFQIIVLELGKLWLGPAAPPLWSSGCGLEVHNREQLSLEWKSRKATIENRIAEMEACDLGFVIEERSIRTLGKSPQASFLRTQLDQLPYFKSLKSNGTTLGDLQSCVTLSKIRQGGLFWWCRPERLNAEAGQPVIEFLMERAKLLYEWDLSAVDSSLPSSHSSLFPKYIYLFQRESDLNVRMDHCPKFIQVRGNLKSHVEVPVMLADAFQSAIDSPPQREHWKIQTRISPQPQREWVHHWPDSQSHHQHEKMEVLKNRSTILGNIATVRSLKNKSVQSPRSKNRMQLPPAILVSVQQEQQKCRLQAEVLPPDHILVENQQRNEFIISLPDALWAAPLAHYLMTPLVQQWMDTYTEKKKGKWVVGEASLKYIPIPQQLIRLLKENQNSSTPLQSAAKEWLDKLLTDLSTQPDQALALFKAKRDSLDALGQTQLFIATSRAIVDCRKEQGKIHTMINENGEIIWQQFIHVIPEQSKVVFSVHPLMHMSGSLPPNVPIHKIEIQQQYAAPGSQPAISFANEKGLQVKVTCSEPALLDILWAQVKDLNQPTWGELTDFVFLPRELNIARTMARQIVQFHELQQQKMQKLHEILNNCSDL